MPEIASHPIWRWMQRIFGRGMLAQRSTQALARGPAELSDRIAAMRPAALHQTVSP